MDRAAITKSVRRWQKRLRLDRWTITIEFLRLEDDQYANCAASPEYLSATIQFDDTCKLIDEDTIKHELLHIFTKGLAHLAEQLAGDDKRWLEMVRIEEERLVTSLEGVVGGEK